MNGVKLFLETSSGQGSEILPTVHNDMSALAAFFARFPKKYHSKLSFCVDTCHIFAAGYDISTKKQAATFMKEWDEKIGLHHLGVVHFNNSVHEVGCRKDRHACIAHGKIPVEGLVEFGMLAMKRGIPVILETPDGPKEIFVLKEMAKHGEVTPDVLRTIKSSQMVRIPDFSDVSDVSDFSDVSESTEFTDKTPKQKIKVVIKKPT
jgi:apurinic endonuclease APN1